MTWPRMPCARAIRPTAAISYHFADIAGLQDLHRHGRAFSDLQRDALARALSRRRGERPERGGRAALLADHLPKLVRRDVQLDQRRALVLGFDDADIVGAIGERARQHFDDRLHAGAVDRASFIDLLPALRRPAPAGFTVR